MHIYAGGFAPNTPFAPYSQNGWSSNPSCHQQDFSSNSPLGSRSSRGSLIGGIVGSVLGGMLCPIPFVGSMVGGLIGAAVGNLLDNLFSPAASSCSHNMNQSYGPQNAHMSMGYGFPTECFSLPPHLGTQAPHPFFPTKKPVHDPVGLPVEDKKPRWTHPVQEFTSRLPDAGDLDRHQVSILPFGPAQRIETQGSNSGSQVQITPLLGRDQQIHTGGDNRGSQTQVAPVVAGTQEIVTGGDNKGNQRQILPVVAAQQSIETLGSNEGSQAQVGTIVAASQEITTGGDNTGDQSRTSLAGSSPQLIVAEGTNSGEQTNRTVFGDVAQASHSAGANLGSQTGSTVLGEGTQEGSGGAGTDFSQTMTAQGGSQEFAAGANSEVGQHLNGGGTQAIAIESGHAAQTEEGGATNQSILGGKGPLVAEQENESGHMHTRGSQSADLITQRAESGVTTLFDDDVSGSVELRNGPGLYEGEGNAGNNHFRIDGSGQTDGSSDLVRLNTGRGDDTAVISTSEGADLYNINLGRGNNDRMVVNAQEGPVHIVGESGETIFRSENWTPNDSTIRTEGMEHLTVYQEGGRFTRWSEGGELVHGRDAGRPGEMTPVGAARLLREHAGLLDRAAGVDSADGIIGAPDLRRALSNPETTPELREAIQYTLGNEAMWNALDARGAGGNRTNMEALNQFIDSYETRQPHSQGPMTDRRAVEVLNYHSALIDSAGSQDADGRFRASDLRAIASGQNASLPPELRAAAQRFLGNEQLQDRVDGMTWEANGPFSPQVFTQDDLSAYVAAS